MKKVARRIGRWSLLAVLCAAAPLSALASASGEGTRPASPYFELQPAFVANYGGPGAMHFLKVEIVLRLAKDEQASREVSHHMPYIRHVLVMLLSKQTDESLATMEGKENLRAQALAAVQGVLQAETGKALVDDLLFTNFVVQR